MHLIFDFDGTLVDSFRCAVEKTLLLADEFHFRKVHEDEIENLRDLSSKEIIRYLNIPFYKIPQLIFQMRHHLRQEMHRLKPAPGMIDLLKTLNQAGFTLGIVTSNSEENVTAWLNQQQISSLFNFIRVESRYFSKKTILKRTLKKYGIDKPHTYYICDETRDISAAKHNDIKSIAVTWGYNSEKALTLYEPTHIVRRAEDILAVLRYSKIIKI